MVFGKGKNFDPDRAMFEMSEMIKDNARHPNIKKYIPHEKQVKFHSSGRKQKLYLGGNRSGKTVGGVTEGIWRATCTHPYRPEINAIGPNQGRVVGVDFTQGIEKIIIPQYKQWLYPSALRGGTWDSAYDKWTRTLNFANQSTIEFMSYDQDLEKFAGTSRHWVHFDEEPPRSIWVECLARLIDTDGDFWITMTPVEGITWVYEELYEGNANNPDGEVEVIEINSIENPYLKASALVSFSKVVGEGEDVNIRIGGGFESKGGRIYKNFDPTVGGPHVLDDPVEDPKALFPNANWTWIMGLDHGLKNPTAVLWMAVNEYGFCVVFDEHYRNDLVIEQHADIIKEKIKQHGRFPDLLVADPSIRNRLANSGVSTQVEYAKLGLPFTLGNNEIKAGIIRVKRYFNAAPLIAGINYRPHPLFPVAGETYARLRISPKCSNLIKEGKLYRWKTYANKKLNDERNPYDEPNPKNDHALDALRYMLMTQPDIYGPNPNTSKSDIDKIVDQLQDQIIRNNPYSDIADPYGMLDESSGWTPANSSPSSEGGWQYDEHMGAGF